jgi:uncharacterized damage-inducible protein DinB
MLEATIARMDDAAWRTVDPPGLAPIRWAHHAIETTEFYRQASPDDFLWGARSSLTANQMPSRLEMIAYLDEARNAYRDWLSGMTDEDLLAHNAFPWTGESVLERILYTLRHTMTHQGELSMILRMNGATETEWR